MKIGETAPGLSKGLERGPVSVLRGNARKPVLLVCEHASSYIPPEFEGLGLDEATRSSHIAWDPGARLVTQHLRQVFDGIAVMAEVSRLIYDCNRPPESPDAMPPRSEVYEIPGNVGLSERQKADRVELYYYPFEKALENEISRLQEVAAMVTIHSFTPTYYGRSREVELGVLHDSDPRLADAMLDFAPEHTKLKTMRNQPYGPEDGVTHTLKRHGIKNGLLNVMIEIRNDLLPTQDACVSIAEELSGMLSGALETCSSTASAASGKAVREASQ